MALIGTPSMVMREAKSWSGFTDKNYFGNVFGSRPQLLTPIFTKILSQSGYQNLDTYLSQFPTIKKETTDDFYWNLIGTSTRNIPLVEARYKGDVVKADDENVGANWSEFELVFGEKYFSDTYVIVGEKNEQYPLQILSEPRQEGMNFVYSVKLFGNIPQGMPGAELVAGKLFSKDYSPVEEAMSIKGGDISYTSSTSMRNSFTHIRQTIKVPGNAADFKVAYDIQIPITDMTGTEVKTFNTWMGLVEWKANVEFQQMKAKALLFGRTNRDDKGRFHNLGKSNYEIKAGSGIREQMSVSNMFAMNKFSLRMLEDLLMAMVAGRMGFPERKFILNTGEFGAIDFNREVAAAATYWRDLTPFNPPVYAKTQSELHQNAMKAGVQFTEWLGPNNIHLTLNVDPMYDDRERNKIYMSDGSLAESHRMDILYIGDKTDPNIQKVQGGNWEDLVMYRFGFRNPFTGAINNQNAGQDEDSATFSRMTNFAAVVKDPSRTATLIPSILL